MEAYFVRVARKIGILKKQFFTASIFGSKKIGWLIITTNFLVCLI